MSAPERIYLNTPNCEDNRMLDAWMQSLAISRKDTDTKYIRADLYEALRAELDAIHNQPVVTQVFLDDRLHPMHAVHLRDCIIKPARKP